MNAKTTAILTDPHPCGHIVYPYTDEGLVAEAITLFASAGLRNGEGVILILTAAHCSAMLTRLQQGADLDVETLMREGRLVCLSAEEFLLAITVEGMPSEDVFRIEMGRMITRSRMSTGKGTEAKVRAYGEMVNLIWKSNLPATISIESLWNEMIDKHRVSLLCTYALNGRGGIPRELQKVHSHVM